MLVTASMTVVNENLFGQSVTVCRCSGKIGTFFVSETQFVKSFKSVLFMCCYYGK